MARTKTYMNWKDVTVSYGAGPTVIALTEITDIRPNIKEGLESWQADGHKFKTQIIAATGERGGSIMGGDIGKLVGMPKNTPCTIVAKLYDSVNGVGSGCLTFTWTGAVFDDLSAGGASNKFAGGQVSFDCLSSDGSTDPLTVVEAS